MVEFIITTDRSMMTDHHGKEFIGFMTTGPPYKVPERIWNWVCMPKPKVDKYGRPEQAPYGLRKIEAALQNAGFDAWVIDPDHVHKHLKNAKAILIGHHDFFALGPPSSEWWIVTGQEPVNSRSFRRFMEGKAMKKARERGIKVVVGGPAAWQWLWKPEFVEKWKVDCIVDGEGEKVVVELAQRILDGKPLPLYVFVGPGEVPSLEEIPAIRAPSVNGLVEIMRGCPRGCKFCSVTLRPLRFYTLEMIEKELRVNTQAGVKDGIIHSEDVLLYRADGVIPQPKPLLELHELVFEYYEKIAWSHCSVASLLCAEEKHRLISKLMDIILSHQDFLGVQIGIETGSPKLARKIMPAKAAPYPPERWPELVEEAFALMHEKRIIPAATLLIGVPGEDDEDILRTIELVERLRSYRSLIIPMYFVPMGAFKDRDWYRKEEITGVRRELMALCLKHSLKWAVDILDKFYIKEWYLLPVKLFIRGLLWLYKRVAKKEGIEVD